MLNRLQKQGLDIGPRLPIETQYNLSNPNYVERYYYALKWGFVFYQKVENGVVTVQNRLNTIFAPQPTLMLPCNVPY